MVGNLSVLLAAGLAYWLAGCSSGEDKRLAPPEELKRQGLVEEYDENYREILANR